LLCHRNTRDVVGGVCKRLQAPAIFLGQPLRIAQQCTHLLPYRLIQVLASHLGIGAYPLTAFESGPIRAGTTIIPIMCSLPVCCNFTTMPAAVGIAALFAHYQSLQQVTYALTPGTCDC